MKRWISISVLLFFIVGLNAQSRTELEARRSSLLKQIESNSKLLATAQKRENTTLADIQGVKAQIVLRQRVVKTIKDELNLMSSSISVSEKKLKQLKASSGDLKSQQARHLKQAYISRKMENPAVYLLSANSINEAFARWRYLEALSRVRNQTYHRLSAQSDSISIELKQLQKLRADKQLLAENAIEQERALSTSKKQSEAVLRDLRKQEKQLKSQLDKQKRESARLAKEIESIISDAVTKTTSKKSLPNAPALAALTIGFETNKGKLPWPVDRGMITGRFGNQPHPVIKSIIISNNGIDITAPPGQEVRAIFNGTVVGKKIIPGFDYMIIVQHGSYYSVYSRLTKAHVKLGDNVKTGQVIGSLQSEATSNPRLHLEVWKNKKQMNPELWIAG
jgi:septal ring factor EnvC (AmiA/AmiB activator)